AQPLIARLAQLAIACPLRERHLGDQLGLCPMRVAGRITGLERRRGPLAPLELVAEPLQRLLVKAGSDLAGIAQPAIGQVIADEQRAEALAGPPRRTPAADDELLAMSALELQPIARAHGDVWAGGSLGHDSLPAALACGAEGGLAVAAPVARVAQRAPKRDRSAQLRLARQQREWAQVLTPELEDVEHVVVHGHVAATSTLGIADPQSL